MAERRKVEGEWRRDFDHRWFDVVKNGSRKCVEVKCCGTWILCDSPFTNTCATCEADYGMDGGRLAPRSQWGIETGETYGDIVGPGGDHYDY